MSQIKIMMFQMMILAAFLGTVGYAVDGVGNINGRGYIEQWGIRWTFDKNLSTDGSGDTYQYGTFVNGDYWIVGPVNITRISPESLVSSGRTINGSMINPMVSGRGNNGYDSLLGSYNASLNVALGVSVSTPLTVPTSSSLISTISIVPEARQKLQTAAVLTVVSIAPSANSFRPPYLGTDKTIKYNASVLRADLLPKLTPVSNTPSLSSVERLFERPWIIHVPGYGVTFLSPVDNVATYGRDMAAQVGRGALSLCLNYTDEQKLPLLKKYVQVGIDLYRYVEDGADNYWEPDGGHCSGRKFPILFAGYMLNDEDMLAIGELGTTEFFFQEDAQTFYVNAANIGQYFTDPYSTFNHIYGDDINTGTTESYTASDVGLPEWGIKHNTGMYGGTECLAYDRANWGANYRGVNGYAWPGMILAAHILGLKSAWNHNALFDYQDRYMATTAPGGPYPENRAIDPFAEKMWDTYRANYGFIWQQGGGTTPTTYTLSVSTTNGTVAKSPNKTTYTSGETVTLTAAPNTGYTFGSWAGDATGTTNPVTITINGNKSVTANFTQAATGMPTDTVYLDTSERVFSTATDYQQIATTGWGLTGTTITLWANSSNLTGSHYILGHTIAGGWSNRIQLYLTDSVLGLGLGDTHFRQSNLATLQTGQWTFVSLSWNGTNYTVQVNGQTAGTGTYTGLSALETFADIGNNGSAASRTEGFAGTIDDVRIYGRALSNAEVTAIYSNGRTTTTPATYTLTTTAANGSITKKVGGVVTTATSFASGTVVELTAAANTGYTFGGWTGSATGTTNPITITMDGNKTVTAGFAAAAYTLAITATNGTVTKKVSGVVTTATSFASGTVVELIAAANTGYTFGGWTGSATGTTNPTTITMDGNKTVTAGFAQTTYSLAVFASNGTVTRSPNKASYSPGETVTLTAFPAAGYLFTGWSGAAAGTTNPITLTMDGNKTITAGFAVATYTLSIAATNGTVTKKVGGVVTTATSFASGTVVELTAAANAGYTFGSWTGSTTGTTSPVTITINANKAVTANFALLTLTSNLTAHLMFDDYAGTTVRDISGSGNAATLVGDPVWGRAWAKEDYLRFTTGSQAAVVSTSTIRPDRGTVAMWVVPENLAIVKYFFGHICDSANRIALYASGSQLAISLGSTSALRTGIAPLTLNTPYHLALTWDGTNYAVYVNGVSKAVGTYTGLTQLATTADIGHMGNPASRSAIAGFKGILDDARLYSRALSASEITALFNTYDISQQTALAFAVSGPVAYQASGLPAGAAFNADTQTFTWQPWYNQTGDYTVAFTAAGQPTQNITVSVHDVELADWYRNFLNYTGKLN